MPNILTKTSVLIGVALSVASANLYAQATPTDGNPAPGQVIHPVKGKPFTAQEWTKMTRTQKDGTLRSIYHQVDLARNSDGVLRRTRHVVTNSDSPATPSAETVISINRAGGDSQVYNAATKKNLMTATAHGEPQAVVATRGPVVPGSAQTQNLGNDTIAGFSVVGTRTIYSYLSSRSPDSNPITVTTDTWYSNDLGYVVKKTISDSLGTTSETELRSIVLGEPDPSLFQAPTP